VQKVTFLMNKSSHGRSFLAHNKWFTPLSYL
jgi:hypothetical protein